MADRTMSKARRAILALVLAGTCATAAPVAFAQESSAPPEQVIQVNVNEADAETIADVLVGVGLSRAQAIVQYREEHGPFADVNDLIDVKGIGRATLETNRARIRLE